MKLEKLKDSTKMLCVRVLTPQSSALFPTPSKARPVVGPMSAERDDLP